MSIDALLFAPDKVAAVHEVARVLRPGARFVFTSWDCNAPLLERPPQVNDHRPLLEAAGFAVETYEETPDWERRQRAVLEGMLAAKEELAVERGAEAAERIVAGLTAQVENLTGMRRGARRRAQVPRAASSLGALNPRMRPPTREDPNCMLTPLRR